MSRKQGIILVLGSPNDDQGRLLSIAQERCAQAIVEFSRNPDYAVLPTGGWGDHFNTTDKPHGFYMKQELIARGIPESAFLPLTTSSNTIEDAGLSSPVIEAYPGAELIIVTSDFHEARAKYIFVREYPDRKIRMSTCVTNRSPDVLARLQEHEQKALEILKNK